VCLFKTRLRKQHSLLLHPEQKAIERIEKSAAQTERDRSLELQTRSQTEGQGKTLLAETYQTPNRRYLQFSGEKNLASM
jgi:hypothetical protein